MEKKGKQITTMMHVKNIQYDTYYNNNKEEVNVAKCFDLFCFLFFRYLYVVIYFDMFYFLYL